jgi:hypothetical protein
MPDTTDLGYLTAELKISVQNMREALTDMVAEFRQQQKAFLQMGERFKMLGEMVERHERLLRGNGQKGFEQRIGSLEDNQTGRWRVLTALVTGVLGVLGGLVALWLK